MFKRWLAILGATVLIVCSSQVLWGGGGGEENPWHSAGGGSGTTTYIGSGGATINSQTVTPLRRVLIVRPAPMGGFYLIWVSLPADVSAKTAVSAKRVGD